MKKFLLDTNICIYFLNGKYNLDSKLEIFGEVNCSISEVTVAELMYGVEKSTHKQQNARNLNQFLTKFKILPIYPSLYIYAKEKARLRQKGIVIDDFDLLIGATAITNDLMLVTNNERHFNQLQDLEFENWTLESNPPQL